MSFSRCWISRSQNFFKEMFKKISKHSRKNPTKGAKLQSFWIRGKMLIFHFSLCLLVLSVYLISFWKFPRLLLLVSRLLLRRIQKPVKHLKWRVWWKQLMVKICQLFPQTAPLLMFDRVLKTLPYLLVKSLDNVSQLNRSGHHYRSWFSKQG